MPLEPSGSGKLWLGRLAAEATSRDELQLVLVERLPDQFTQRDELAEGLVREAKSASSLVHEHLLRTYAAGRIDGHFSLVHAFPPGDTLDTLIGRAAPPVPVTLRLLADIAEALGYAHHQQQTYHGAISPDAIFVGWNGVTRLGRFGTAKIVRKVRHNWGELNARQLSYLSPEHCMNDPVDTRTDIFNVGTVLWELLTGRTLFEEEDEFERMRAICERQPPPPTRFNDHVPPLLNSLTLKALSIEPDDRFDDGAELKSVIKGVFSRSQTAASHQKVSQWVDKSAPKRRGMWQTVEQARSDGDLDRVLEVVAMLYGVDPSLAQTGDAAPSDSPGGTADDSATRPIPKDIIPSADDSEPPPTLDTSDGDDPPTREIGKREKLEKLQSKFAERDGWGNQDAESTRVAPDPYQSGAHDVHEDAKRPDPQDDDPTDFDDLDETIDSTSGSLPLDDWSDDEWEDEDWSDSGLPDESDEQKSAQELLDEADDDATAEVAMGGEVSAEPPTREFNPDEALADTAVSDDEPAADSAEQHADTIPPDLDSTEPPADDSSTKRVSRVEALQNIEQPPGTEPFDRAPDVRPEADGEEAESPDADDIAARMRTMSIDDWLDEEDEERDFQEPFPLEDVIEDREGSDQKRVKQPAVELIRIGQNQPLDVNVVRGRKTWSIEGVPVRVDCRGTKASLHLDPPASGWLARGNAPDQRQRLPEAPTSVDIEPGDVCEVTDGDVTYRIRFFHPPTSPDHIGRANLGRSVGLYAGALLIAGILHALAALGILTLHTSFGVAMSVGDKPKKEVFAEGKLEKPEEKEEEDEPEDQPEPPAPPEPVDPTEQEAKVPESVQNEINKRLEKKQQASKGKSEAEALAAALQAPSDSEKGSVKKAVSNIEAVDSPSGSADMKVGGSLEGIKGNDVQINTGGSGDGESKLGNIGSQLGEGTGKLGKREGSGGGKVRGQVSSPPSQTKVEGRLARSKVSKVINQHQGQIQGCYEKQLLTNAGLSGKVTFEWTITRSGRVSGARQKTSTLNSPPVSNCILGILRKLTFPKPKGGSVSITYPFVFRSGG